MGLTVLPNAGGQRACLSLWFQSVRMVVQRSCCGLNWSTNVVPQPIPDWGSWFTVAESAKVDLISLPSEFVLVLHIATDEILGWPGALGVSVCRANKLLSWYNHCFLEHVPQGVRNHGRYFFGFRQNVGFQGNWMWLFIAYTNGREESGLLNWSGFRTDQFSPQGSGLLNWSGFPMGGLYG